MPEAQSPPVELSHKLKLFEDVEVASHSQKKPVVKETYEEIVFRWAAVECNPGG